MDIYITAKPRDGIYIGTAWRTRTYNDIYRHGSCRSVERMRARVYISWDIFKALCSRSPSLRRLFMNLYSWRGHRSSRGIYLRHIF